MVIPTPIHLEDFASLDKPKLSHGCVARCIV
jgi:hypothetical protein